MKDTEIWKDIIGSEHYQVSNLGRIKNKIRKRVLTERIMKQHLTQGYPSFTVNNRSMRTHRLVCEAFLGPSNGLHINHKNGIKTDNRVENLEYVTQKENNQHGFRTGLINNSGENHGKAKLSNIQVIVIREALNNGHKGIAVSKYFNVSQACISMIKHGNRFNCI